jgi:hypothetical protein
MVSLDPEPGILPKPDERLGSIQYDLLQNPHSPHMMFSNVNLDDPYRLKPRGKHRHEAPVWLPYYHRYIILTQVINREFSPRSTSLSTILKGCLATHDSPVAALADLTAPYIRLPRHASPIVSLATTVRHPLGVE